MIRRVCAFIGRTIRLASALDRLSSGRPALKTIADIKPPVYRFEGADESLPAAAARRQEQLAKLRRAGARLSSSPLKSTGPASVVPFARKERQS